MSAIRDRIKDFRRVPVEELKANGRNFRTHPEAQQAALSGLLREVGIANAVIAYESERFGGLTLIDGHLRIETHHGAWPVLVLDVDDAEADLLLATMDPLAALAGTDKAKLSDLLAGINSGEAGVQALIADVAEKAGLYRELPAPGEGGDEFDVTPAEGPTRSKSGDLWQLGEHRLLVADCTVRANVERLMGGDRASLGFTSPPYNVGDNAKLWRGEESKYIVGDRDDLAESDYLNLLCGFTDAALVVCDWLMVNLQMLAGNKLALVEYLHHFKRHLADIAIWNKQNAQPAMPAKVMNSQFEFLFHFILSPKDCPPRSIGNAHFRGTLPNVYSAPGNFHNEFADVHSATFPLHLPSWWISNLTRFGDVVLDSFGGTGTTLIACERLGRLCRIMEKEPAYADVILRRWEAETGHEAVLVERLECA